MINSFTFFVFVFGSAHTDCVIAEDHEVAEVFLHQVDRLVDIFTYMSYPLLSLTLYCDLFLFLFFFKKKKVIKLLNYGSILIFVL
jgi:hypothetical protein